jgi:hypothetical protein
VVNFPQSSHVLSSQVIAKPTCRLPFHLILKPAGLAMSCNEATIKIVAEIGLLVKP